MAEQLRELHAHMKMLGIVLSTAGLASAIVQSPEGGAELKEMLVTLMKHFKTKYDVDKEDLCACLRDKITFACKTVSPQTEETEKAEVGHEAAASVASASTMATAADAPVPEGPPKKRLKKLAKAATQASSS